MSTQLMVASPTAQTTHSSLCRFLFPCCCRSCRSLCCCCCLHHRFKELRDYVLARRDALGGGARGPGKAPSMMDLDLDDATALKKSGKGFA